ncbi:MAG: type I restriction enzyme HsdR N-terminal domain-containing protein [Desulfovibrio sp.]|uniref:type I restriction enzyme HsdR N-terminal domain-containing protein n=1 Tax=Desulfovibrio sp. 7SRBS1 TaxID=3378064 RepID=UPI003B3CFB35
MHETNLGGTIRDYLTGEEVPETTYEEIRQALARMMVQERGYPKDRLASKVGVYVNVDDEPYCRVVDLVAYDDAGAPLLVLIFCSGMPGTYDRETVAAARLIEGGPAPLAIATDTKDAILLDVLSGEILARGMDAIPHYADLKEMAQGRTFPPMEGKRRQAEERILYAYSEFLTSCCEGTCCPIPK